MRPIDADAVCERCRKSGAICTGSDCEIPTMPTLTPPNEWVSVDKRLPEHLKDVIALYGNGRIDIDWVDSSGDFKFDSIFDGVTHWMPLPAPPDRRPPEAKDNNVPTNEPLTIEELLKMDGEPVYVVFMPDSSGERSQSWALVNVDEKYGEVYLVDSIPGASCYYDEIWADLEGIYRRPPEGEGNA